MSTATRECKMTLRETGSNTEYVPSAGFTETPIVFSWRFSTDGFLVFTRWPNRLVVCSAKNTRTLRNRFRLPFIFHLFGYCPKHKTCDEHRMFPAYKSLFTNAPSRNQK